MSLPADHSQSPAEALGCGLLLVGLLGSVFGVAALFGISDRVELEFFGIGLNDTTGRVLWTAGSLIALAAGLLILRARGRAA